MSKRSPEVSIGMPVYNGEQYIREALDSLLAQSFSDFELIISDNASTDGTGTICDEYALIDRRIQYIRQSTNIGQWNNFKCVLNKAVGEFFMWAAADDAWGRDFVADSRELLKTNKRAIAAIARTKYGTSSSQDAGSKTIKSALAIVRRYKFLVKPGPNARFYSLYRTSVIKKIAKGEYEFHAADWAIIFDLLEYGDFLESSRGFGFYKRDTGLGSDTNRAVRDLSDRGIPRILPLLELLRHILKRRMVTGILLLPLIFYLNWRQWQRLYQR